MKVYIAGPYTKGDVAANVYEAIKYAHLLADLGCYPFVPHLTHFWHLVFQRPYEYWLNLDNQFLPCCDVLLRIPGESNGADKEVELANSLDIPVFYEWNHFIHYHKALKDKEQGKYIPLTKAEGGKQ